MTDMSPAEAVFFAALAKADPAKRAAYLNEACGADVELRRRVDRLLEAHPQVGSFLQEGAAVVPAPLMGEGPGFGGGATVERWWVFARTWLYADLADAAPEKKSEV